MSNLDEDESCLISRSSQVENEVGVLNDPSSTCLSSLDEKIQDSQSIIGDCGENSKQGTCKQAYPSSPGTSSDYPTIDCSKFDQIVAINDQQQQQHPHQQLEEIRKGQEDKRPADHLNLNKSLTSSLNGPFINHPQPTFASDISIMQESTDLHWFNESSYQSEKNPLIENMPITSENINTESSNRNSNHLYHTLARNIDATFAEIDMETFRSEDINHIYSTLPELDSSCGPVVEDGGEEFASVTGSLLDEMHSGSHYLSSKRFASHGHDLVGSSSIFDSSLIEETSKTLSSATMRSERLPGLYERSHIDVSGVSIDSLDFSSSENDNTNEMILRCREQDKTKYTIAFEESVSSVTTLSDSADDTKNNSEESDTLTQFNPHHHHLHHHHHHNFHSHHQQQQQTNLRRRRIYGVVHNVNSKKQFSLDNAGDGDDDDDDYHDLVKSEYTTWNMVKRPNGGRELIKLRRYPFHSVAKQSQSLPNIVHVTSVFHGDEPLFPPLGSYVPLYDLNKSNTTTNSSNSEVSPPRSLIRLFIKNRTSPNSSSPGSSSTSFEGHLVESSELNTPHGPPGSISNNNYGPSRFVSTSRAVGPGPGQNYCEKQSTNEMAYSKRTVAQQCLNEDWNNFEDSLVNEGLGGGLGPNLLNPLLAPKSGFSRLKQASPIREEDILTDTSRGDEAIASGTDESYHGNGAIFKNNNVQQWPAHHFDNNNNNNQNNNRGENNEHVNVMGARRSISVDRFMSTQCGGGPSSSSGTSNNIRRSSDYGSTNINKIRFSSGREFGSLSSGYLSSRQGSSEWHRKANFNHPALQQQQQQPLSQCPLKPSLSSGSIPTSSGRKYSISVTTMKTASTQVPVHIQDKQVQTTTSCKIDDESGFIIREYPTNTVREKEVPLPCYAKDSPSMEINDQDNRKPLYICFPNYSLPDLSFLRTLSCPCTPKEEGPSTVYLSPTKLKLPQREFAPASANLKRPFAGRKGVRPKSCTDYENLIANRSFNHIKDWDSLKVLLPNEFKSLIARLEGDGKMENTNEKTTDQVRSTDQNEPKNNSKQSGESANTQPRKKSNVNNLPNTETNTNPFSSNYKEPNTQTSPQREVKLRLRKKSSMETLDKGNYYQSQPLEVNNVEEPACSCQQRKRYSLQEPPSDYCHPLQPETTSADCLYRDTISRSVTMPSCVCHTQPVCHLNCQPHYHHHPHPHDHHYYTQSHPHHLSHFHHQQHIPHHSSANSCCQPGAGGGSGGVQGPGGVRSSSMSTNVMSNEMHSSLVNGLFEDPSVDRLCHLLSKGMSVKDFTNIIGGGGGGGGITHKNRLSSPSKPYEPIKELVAEETDSMCISSKEETWLSSNNNINGDDKRIEKVIVEANCNKRRDCQSKNDTHNGTVKGDEKLQSNFNVIKKRWESLVSPVSSSTAINSPELAPNVIEGRRRGGGDGGEREGRNEKIEKSKHGKGDKNSQGSTTPSTPSSSSASSSTALPVKPKVPIKPPLSSLRPASVPIAKRPTTLGANNNNVFRSMIPIAKGSRSPPMVKQLTSPNSKTLPRSNAKRT